MPELTATIVAKREEEHQNRRFMAAMQGVDLEAESGGSKGQKEWENMKARVFSGGQAQDSEDVTSLQGANASKAGFGIGMGLEYSDLRSDKSSKNPLG